MGLLYWNGKEAVANEVDVTSFIAILKATEAATLEEAADIANEHGCPSYHELCDCRRKIADDLDELAQERRT